MGVIDNGNGILEILKMSLLCLVKYLGQFNVTSYNVHNAGSAECHRHVTENEHENTRRSLEAGVYWHLFVCTSTLQA